MADLVFTIRTPAELSGAESAARALEVNIGKAKALGQEYGALETRLHSVRQSIEAFKQSSDAQPAPKLPVDESERYAAALKRMSDSDTESARDKRLEALRNEIAWRRQLAEEADAQIAAENATKSAIKDGTAGLNEAAGAADKAFTSKKQLKDMVKQLGHEFPLLGSIGRLALNPIAFTTAAITGAFALWNFRVQELTRSLGGIQMPDVSDDQIARIERAGTALKAYAESAAGIGKAEAKIKENFDAQLARIDTALETAKRINAAKDELAKALGQTPAGTADQVADRAAEDLRIQALRKEQTDKRAAGEKLLKEAGGVTSEEKEAAIAEKYKDAAAAAREEIKAAEARKAEVLDLKDLATSGSVAAASPVNQYKAARAVLRYGKDASYDDAAAIEDATIRSQREIVAQFQSFQANAAARAAARAKKAEGEGLIKQADELTPEINRRVETQTRRRATDSSVAAIEFAETKVKAGRPEAATLVQAAEGADIIRAGGKADASQKAAIAQAQQMLGLTSQNAQTIIVLLAKLNDSQIALERALKQIEARQKSSRNK